MAEQYVNPATMDPDYVPPRMTMDPDAVPGRAALPAVVNVDELPNLQMARIRTSLGAGVEYALGAVHAEVAKFVLETVEDRIRLELEAAESWGRAQEHRENASAASAREAGPRTWELPLEPGPEVGAVADCDGDRWSRHFRSSWRCESKQTYARSWGELLDEYGPLTDATPVEPESAPAAGGAE